MAKPHVMAVPFPAQGHVIPLLELSQWLVSHGVKVTFVNTHFTHRRVVESSSSPAIGEVVDMVSVWDGLEEWEDRSDKGKISEGMLRVMPAEVEALITKLNRSGGPKITCVIAEWGMAWAVADAAERIGLRTATFYPAAATTLALSVSIPKLVADGVIDDDGQPLEKQTIKLSPTIPPINSADFFWACLNDRVGEKNLFRMIAMANNVMKSSDWIICNSSHHLEEGTFSSFPQFKPIGPLLATNRLAKSEGSFWAEDSTCLSWLDRHPPNSVIYAAFGSLTILDTTQFQELALGLELTGMPFLWVVRQDMTTAVAYPEGFMERVGGRGMMVEWAPQQQVFCHPSLACFVSHCGWNSTMEGVGYGVPFLCWPYFLDQFTNRNYICDEWKVGLGLEKDENGIITKGEVKEKVEILVGDGVFKERILNLRARVMESVRGGRSHTNFSDFVGWIKNLDVVVPSRS